MAGFHMDLTARYSQKTGIYRQKAKKAAFQDAGIQETDVSRVRVSKEQNEGMLSYDVEFHAGDKEYEFEIDANNGNFLKWSEERD